MVTDPEARHTMDFWMGCIQLVAVGTLLYNALMHILPEVYGKGHSHEHVHHEVGSIQDKEESMEKQDERPNRSIQLMTLIAGLVTAELLTLAPHPH